MLVIPAQFEDSIFIPLSSKEIASPLSIPNKSSALYKGVGCGLIGLA